MANIHALKGSLYSLTAAMVIAWSTPLLSQQLETPLRQVRFIENKGQLSDMQGNPVPFVFFKAGVRGMELYVTDKGLTYNFFRLEEDEEREERHAPSFSPKVHEYSWEVINLRLKGALIRKENIIKEEQQQGAHSFYSIHQSDGITDVHEYGKIIITDVYPGIDWVLYNTSRGGFKYDFILHAGANADNIRLCYEGVSEAALNAGGNIQVNTKYGGLREDKPVSYLYNEKTPVNSAFYLVSKSESDGIKTSEFGFAVTGRNIAQAMVIDPLLTWSTYFGGTNYEGTMATEVDPTGNLFACGYGASTNFPYHNAGTYFEGTNTLTTVAFILKFSTTGVLLWSTNYSGIDIQQDMAIDKNGNVFTTGAASYNGGMPVQTNSTYFQGTQGGQGDAYILKFDNSGNRLWATYFGGSSYDTGTSIAADQSGNIFLTGTTTSTNFPVMNANTYYVSTMPNDAAFVSKFDNGGTLLWSTYYEGFYPNNASVDNAGNVFITGRTFTNFATYNPGSGAYYQGTSPSNSYDIGLLKFSNTGARTWATFYGGDNSQFGQSVIPDKTGRAYLLCYTSSTNMPVMNAGGYYKSTLTGNTDIFLMRFSATGALQWATYYGSYGDESISTNDNLALDSCGNLYASFESNSSGLPTQPSCDGGYYDNQYDSTGYSETDQYIVRFNNATQINWASYLGGNGYDFRASLAVDHNSKLFITGEWVEITGTVVPNYPIVSPGSTGYCDSTNNGYDDIYIMRFNPESAPQPFNYQGPYCSSTASVPPITTSLSPGGTYSASAGLSVNPTTGVIYPKGSAAGIYTISYTGSNTACSCAQGSFASTSTATVQLLPAPNMSVAGSNTPCIGQVATRTISGAYTYTWSNGFQATIFSAKIYSTTVLTVTGTAQNSCTSVFTFTIFSKGCDGLSEEALPGVKVFPNPNSGTFTIESQQPADLILTNMLGQQIRSIKIGKEEQQIEIKDLPKGVYILRDVLSKSGGGLRIVVE